MKRASSIVLGLAVILVGVIWGLNELGITDINIFFDGWWTLFIIVPCAVGLFTSNDKFGHFVFLLIGVMILLACNDVFDKMWQIILPVLVVAVGLKMVFGVHHEHKDIVMIKGDLNKKSHTAVFSGQELDYTNEVFEGGEFTAAFGGIECNLRNAIFERDVVIKAKCAFGGIDILLPETVNAKVTSNSILGGVDVKRHKNSPENAITVYIEASCAFGGVEVK